MHLLTVYLLKHKRSQNFVRKWVTKTWVVLEIETLYFVVLLFEQLLNKPFFAQIVDSKAKATSSSSQ